LFLGLIVMVGLFFLHLQWKKKTMKKIGEPKLVKLLIGNYSSRLFNSKFIIVSAAFAFGILAAMNPRKPGASGKETRSGIDMVIAIDVSKSMLATDLAPNRLERAKQFAGKLINEMPDDRIALVIFAGKAYLQMPLTVDHGAAQLYLSSANPSAIPQQGTVIGDALKMSEQAFSDKDPRFKSVILISDGEDHDESALSTAKELASKGVMINTVGIGSVEGSTIIDPATGTEKKDESGNTVISKLNDDELKKIAAATNGAYVHLQNSDEAVSQVNAQLSQIERKAFTDESTMNFRNLFIVFAAIMFLLLIIESLIPEKRKAIA
jgi:Ca-activated chloride channel family protein